MCNLKYYKTMKVKDFVLVAMKRILQSMAILTHNLDNLRWKFQQMKKTLHQKRFVEQDKLVLLLNTNITIMMRAITKKGTTSCSKIEFVFIIWWS